MIGQAKERESENKKARVRSPGPNSYEINKTLIGDMSSVKICIPTAPRPISAKVGTVKRIMSGPGPSDYDIPNPDKYLKRSRVIPNLTFSTQGRSTKSMEKLDVRSKSPGP